MVGLFGPHPLYADEEAKDMKANRREDIVRKLVEEIDGAVGLPDEALGRIESIIHNYLGEFQGEVEASCTNTYNDYVSGLWAQQHANIRRGRDDGAWFDGSEAIEASHRIDAPENEGSDCQYRNTLMQVEEIKDFADHLIPAAQQIYNAGDVRDMVLETMERGGGRTYQFMRFLGCQVFLDEHGRIKDEHIQLLAAQYNKLVDAGLFVRGGIGPAVSWPLFPMGIDWDRVSTTLGQAVLKGGVKMFKHTLLKPVKDFLDGEPVRRRRALLVYCASPAQDNDELNEFLGEPWAISEGQCPPILLT